MREQYKWERKKKEKERENNRRNEQRAREFIVNTFGEVESESFFQPNDRNFRQRGREAQKE